MIRFDLSINLDYIVNSPTVFVFVLQPTNTPYQRVTWDKLSTEPELPVVEQIHGSPGNRHVRVHAEPGPFKLHYEATVDLVHHFALPGGLNEEPIAELHA